MRRITVLGLAGVGLLLAGCDYSFQGGGQVNLTPGASPASTAGCGYSVTGSLPSCAAAPSLSTMSAAPALTVPATTTAAPSVAPSAPALSVAPLWSASQCTWAETMLGPGPEPNPDNFPKPSPWPPGWGPPDYDAQLDATVPGWTLPVDWTAQDTPKSARRPPPACSSTPRCRGSARSHQCCPARPRSRP